MTTQAPVFTRTFVSDPHEVRAAVVAGHEALAAAQVDRDRLVQVQLALAEALNNVAEHAYQERSDGWILLEISLSENSICVDIRDRGVPLPTGGVPNREPRPEGTPREALPEGGFGWYLMRKIAGTVNHHREQGENHLSMVFER